MSRHPTPVRIEAVEATLPDGTHVLVRPVIPADRELLRRGFERLSEVSRLRRFMAPVSELTEEQLDYLTRVDGVDHVALGAVLRDEPTEGIGVARFIRLQDDPAVAEAAVTVLDEYQGRGLGTLLVVLLAQVALAGGVTTFRAFVLEENLPMRKLLEAFGATTHHDSPGVLRIDVPLLPVQPPASPAREILRAVAARKIMLIPPDAPPTDPRFRVPPDLRKSP